MSAARSDYVVVSVTEIYGRQLRTLRENVGMSQRALARDAEISHTLLSRSEAGNRLPADIDEIRRIGRALRLESDDVDRLLAAAGYWPLAFLELGPHDPTLGSLARSLTSANLTPNVRSQLRRAVEATIDAIVSERSVRHTEPTVTGDIGSEVERRDND